MLLNLFSFRKTKITRKLLDDLLADAALSLSKEGADTVQLSYSQLKNIIANKYPELTLNKKLLFTLVNNLSVNYQVMVLKNRLITARRQSVDL